MGADDAVLVSDAARRAPTCKAPPTPWLKPSRPCNTTCILFGSRSTDGETGCVPAAAPELLNLPLLSATAKFEVNGATAKATARPTPATSRTNVDSRPSCR